VALPVRLSVDDDLGRSRLTVFFRLLLAIPHLVWLALWANLVFLVAIANWISTLAAGTPPAMFHRFTSAFVRYAVQVFAFLFLAANPFPGFTGKAGVYPIDVQIDEPRRQSRWRTGFRAFLALPALILAGALLGGGGWTSAGVSAGAGATAAFLGWFVSLLRGRMPRGLRDLIAYGLGYSAQAYGYLLLLTDRYPTSDPAAHLPFAQAPRHPVRVTLDDDLARSRVTVALRLLLAIPHLVWLWIWSWALVLAIVANWFTTLIAGRSPLVLHEFIAAFLRYATHVYAYLVLLANPFPRFLGLPRTYPLDVEIDDSKRQNRWITGFRVILVIPAFLLAGSLGGVLFVVGVFGWFASLARGRMPEGLRNLGAYALRYLTQTYAYLMLLNDRYPYSGPTVPSGAGARE